MFTSLKLWAEGKYRDHHLDSWLEDTEADYVIEVMGRPAGSKGFVKLPHRWVVERTFAGIGRYRKNSRDYRAVPAAFERSYDQDQFDSSHAQLLEAK